MVREGEKCLGCLMSICLKETVACCSVTAVVCFLLVLFGWFPVGHQNLIESCCLFVSFSF